MRLLPAVAILFMLGSPVFAQAPPEELAQPQPQTRGRATTGIAIELDRAAPSWDTLAWTYVEAWTGTIPGLPAGTTPGR